MEQTDLDLRARWKKKTVWRKYSIASTQSHFVQWSGECITRPSTNSTAQRGSNEARLGGVFFRVFTITRKVECISTLWRIRIQKICDSEKSPSGQKTVPRVKSSTVQNDVCAEFDTRRLFSHPSPKVRMFTVLIEYLIFRSMSMICDITNSFSANPGPRPRTSTRLWSRFDAVAKLCYW